MAKLEFSEMPPLTVAKHNEIERIENDFCKKLAYCEHHAAGYDGPRAEEYLRSYTIALFECYHGFYSEFPELARHALRGSQHNAIRAAISAYSRVFVVERALRPVLERRLARTIEDHLKRQARKSSTPAEKKTTPAELLNAYRKQFPQAKIVEVCWAAKQTTREWRRWIKGNYVPGNTPDRSFRSVLTSSKPLSEIRPEARPKGWK